MANGGFPDDIVVKIFSGLRGLPDDIVVEICSRCPTKFVVDMRSAERWKTLLSTPEFIKSHFQRKPHQENLILITPYLTIHSIDTIKDDTVSEKLELSNSWSKVVGSCDGLVLLVNETFEKFLVNPITRESVIIPDPPRALKKGKKFTMLGLGKDGDNDDYKVVTLSYYGSENEHEPDCTFVDVYSVKTGNWERVDSCPYDHDVPELSSGAFVDGDIYWLASSRESSYPVISAFSLADKVLKEIPAPTGFRGNLVCSRLVVLGGCLCVIEQSHRQVDIWKMKSDGLGEPWTKISVDADGDGQDVFEPLFFYADGQDVFEPLFFDADYGQDAYKPLCFADNDVVALRTKSRSLVAYNLEEKKWKDIVVDKSRVPFIDGSVFVDSLVSPLPVGTLREHAAIG